MLIQRRGGGCHVASKLKPENDQSIGYHWYARDGALPDRKLFSLSQDVYLHRLLIQGRTILGRPIAPRGFARASR